MYLGLLFGLLGCFIYWRIFAGMDKKFRYVLGFFFCCYFITTVIGATLMGLDISFSTERLGDRALFPNLKDDLIYWFLLFHPLYTFSIPMWFVGKLKVRKRITIPRGNYKNSVMLCFIFLLFSGLLMFTFYMCGISLSWSDFINIKNEFDVQTEQRIKCFSALPFLAFAFMYTILPNIIFMLSYMWSAKRTISLLLFILFGTFLVVYLVTVTVQKAPLMVFLVLFIVGLSYLNIFKKRHILAATGGLFLFLMLYQIYAGWAEWGYLDNFYYLTSRIAVGTPMYYTLYPSQIPYEGIDFGMDLIGFGRAAQTSAHVHNCWFGSGEGSNMPAPVNMSAYAEGGVYYSVIAMIIISLIISGCTKYNRPEKSFLNFGFFMAILNCTYYVTQVQLRDTLISSYGVFWSIMFLIGIKVVYEILGLRRKNIIEPYNTFN